MISPTIGRVVWYYPSGAQPTDQPLPALVARVWGDRCVNLAIFDANGVPYPKPPTSITLVQDGDTVPTGGNYCAWMPYQIGKAKEQTPTAPATAPAASPSAPSRGRPKRPQPESPT